MKKKSFGSGYFGEWIEDEFGLPAFRYICDQINDPKAITPMHKEWRSETEHLHQVGNDRLVAVSSNYGYIQVRQDEGSPKYLNEYNPKQGYYAGGFGYLKDKDTVLSTYYLGDGRSFERIFGIGYLRKKIKATSYNIDQIVFAPFGDDPILISQITITNNQDKEIDLKWFEYWGCNMYQFSLKAYLEFLTKKDPRHPVTIRREFSRKFIHKFEIIMKGLGIKETKVLEDNKEEKTPSYPKPEFEDNNPPMTFLVSLDEQPELIFTNGFRFFGKGGVESPDMLKDNLASDLSASGEESAMILGRTIHLQPRQSRTIYFLYGYVPEGFEIENLVKKYKNNVVNIFKKSCELWKKERIKLKIKNETWVNREVFWHYYYLRGAMTYDSYFKEHILSQGHVYQYIIGFQGAARDPLQHALPFIYVNPNIVKNVIRYTLKTTFKDGEIPYGITGSGQLIPLPIKPSDQEMWLLWLTSEYILATRDTDFLDEIISIYPVYSPKAETSTIREILARCYWHFVKGTGIGRHDLQKLSNGDWNDGVILGNIPPEEQELIKKEAESVLNAAMASYTLKLYAEMLIYIGDNELAGHALKYSKIQCNAVHSQWTGNWFRRAWLSEDLGWIGNDQMWLEPQPWAIIGDAADQEQKTILVKNIDELLRQPSKIGAKLHSKGFDSFVRKKGQGLNAGIWPSINGTLIWALSLVDNEMAWDEWKKNSLALHAENFPEIWYGIWSGPDNYNSDFSKYHGHTVFNESLLTDNYVDNNDEALGIIGVAWTDFPVFNLHPHAWPLYSLIKLIGVKFNKNGVEIIPTFPKEQYEFSSKLFGFTKSKEGYSGWYAPMKEGSWEISVSLKESEIKDISKLEVNGIEQKLIIKDDIIVWKGRSDLNKPLKWKLYK
ncbi:MAG: GH36-type glycosyl hydrolase domain-containing protein [Promethearchaeota archaeon]